MKKYYYEGPTFKLRRGSRDPTFKFWRGSWGTTFKLWGGSQVLGPEVPGPGVLVPLLHHTVLRKKCSENMQEIYRRTPMSKCDLNKFTLQLYWNHTLIWVFSCEFAAYFQNTFSQKHLWTAASDNSFFIFRCDYCNIIFHFIAT